MASRKNTTVQQFAPSTPTMKERWDIQKVAIKKKYPSLKDSDLRYEEGKKGAMWDALQIKLGLSKEELRKLMSGI